MIFERDLLFPDPIREEQGLLFYKEPFCLAAALHAANLSKKEVETKLAALAAQVDQELEEQKDIVKRDEEVMSKRQRLFQVFGKVL
ncbi:MAG: hypothetical protein Q9181_006730, partial [Wetmoreana brouardii]